MKLINNSNEAIEYTNIAVALGDGIGPEILEPTLQILKDAGARLKFEFVDIGEKFYHKGYESGISDEAWEVIRRNKVFLKGPITTPQGSGYKSINVTLRKTLGLYANVRPCVSYFPFINTQFADLDVVVIRENEEDLYAGIEYKHTQDSVHCIKVITRTGCEKIVRYAFEYARKNNRKKVTCMVKDNIMKMTDGLFHDVFKEISQEYKEIEIESYIIDIGAARLATVPNKFDVVVTLNLYGDIVSDIVAELTGSVGLAGSANIGEKYAMFEAIHGSAPTIVGQGIANPSSVINASIQMLAYIGQGDIAEKIQNSLLYTIESGCHTPDIFRSNVSKQKVSTQEFAELVSKNLGKSPEVLKSKKFSNFEFDSKPDEQMLGIASPSSFEIANKAEKKLVGVDLFIDYPSNAEEIGQKVDLLLKNSEFELKIISSRGVKVYPMEFAKYSTSDSWRARIVKKDKSDMKNSDIIDILSIFAALDVTKTENLYNFNEKRGYTVSQGE